MKNAFIDKNGNNGQVSTIGRSKDISTAGVIDEASGVVRVKAITDSRIRLEGQTDVGVLLSEYETEYFNISEGSKLELVSGSINLMY
jgi:hypothetical protein